jgi:hypothetical protein
MHVVLQQKPLLFSLSATQRASAPAPGLSPHPASVQHRRAPPAPAQVEGSHMPAHVANLPPALPLRGRGAQPSVKVKRTCRWTRSKPLLRNLKLA